MKRISKKIIFIFFIVIAIVVFIFPDRNKDHNQVVITNFSLTSDDNIAIGEMIDLLIIIDNEEDLEIDAIIVNGNRLEKELFNDSSTNGRIMVSYLLTNSDFKDNNLYLSLDAFIYNDIKKIQPKYIIKPLE